MDVVYYIVSTMFIANAVLCYSSANFEMDSSLTGKNCPAERRVFESTAASIQVCAVASEERGSAGFVYVEGTSMCYGCDVMSMSKKGEFQDLQGAVFYRRDPTLEDFKQTVNTVINQTIGPQKIICLPLIRAGGEPMAQLLYVGVTVKRGKDWKWNNQDGEGPGKVTRVDIDNLDTKWINVSWDNGNSNSYRMGVENAYDLVIVEEEFDYSRC